MTGMKIIVCGSRSFANDLARHFVFKKLDGIHKSADGPITYVAHGGAKGPDTFAEEWARSRQITTMAHIPNWDLHKAGAGPLRNIRMMELESPDTVVAFWNGRSHGTRHMTSLTLDAPTELILFPVEGFEPALDEEEQVRGGAEGPENL